MPMCTICKTPFCYSSQYDPDEPCMCGEEFSYDLWAATGTWEEYARLKSLQLRWRLAGWLGKLAEWVAPL